MIFLHQSRNVSLFCIFQVTVPSQLEGVAYIQVEVKTAPDMVDLTSAALKMPPGLSAVPTTAYWQNKLESAQNVLFCKELFAQLAKEAVQVNIHLYFF